MGRKSRKRSGKDKAGYEPTRPSRLRPADAPPPVPTRADDRGETFGTADEDGLRMLAALQTLTSLEPDYYDDDLTAEASITIVESAGHDAVAEALAGRGADGHRRPEGSYEPEPPSLLLNGYDTFIGAGEEAEVEIVEVAHTFDAPTPAADVRRRHATTLTDRIAAAGGTTGAGRRFLKALSGES